MGYVGEECRGGGKSGGGSLAGNFTTIAGRKNFYRAGGFCYVGVDALDSGEFELFD